MTLSPLEVPVSGLALNFTQLGLDPADLGWDIDHDLLGSDGRVELHGDDGPLLIIDGYDPLDPDQLLAVAEWFDALATQATAAADELRRITRSICDDCDGRGIRGDDTDCRRCGGTGSLS